MNKNKKLTLEQKEALLAELMEDIQKEKAKKEQNEPKNKGSAIKGFANYLASYAEMKERDQKKMIDGFLGRE